MRVSGAMTIRLGNCSLPICTGVKSGCGHGCEILFNIGNKQPIGSLSKHVALFASRKILYQSVHSSIFPVMGRPKNFTRDAVLEKALPVFWRRGFADASLHELEQATGVNKSGLYAEFKDKEDLFVQSLRYYLESLEEKGLLTAEPLGWNNIERFLKIGPSSLAGQKGSFAVNSMRESAVLPREAIDLVTRSRSNLKQLLAKNIEAERPKMNPESLAQLVLTFFTGLSMEHNLSLSRRAVDRNIDNGVSPTKVRKVPQESS